VDQKRKRALFSLSKGGRKANATPLTKRAIGGKAVIVRYCVISFQDTTGNRGKHSSLGWESGKEKYQDRSGQCSILEEENV